MGVEPFLITSSLTLVVSQRLARVPCSKCSEPVQADPKTLELLGLDPDQIDAGGLRSGPGCGFCAQTGYQGRVGLFEVVRVTHKVRELIVGRATEVAIKEEAVAGGMRSMRFDGLTKALAGRTTLEEVLRVTPPDPDLARRATRRTGQAPAQVPPAVKTPPKVLVLDDDRAIAEVAAAVLVDGYQVVAASHLDEGLRMVEAARPDLVLVDLDLPGADPTQLLARLRQSSVDGLPVPVMSATDDHPTRDRASAAGATGFIPKPFTEPELRAEVAAILQRRRSWPTTRPAPAAQANRRSPVSSSSTGRAQVGQYQRASRGVPQARWRRPSASGAPEWSAPHWASRRRAPASSRPEAVSS
jgi:CheY-like chemotaxis protein